MPHPTLRLGHADPGHLPADRPGFLRRYHDWDDARRGFRDEADDAWRDFAEAPAGAVVDLQTALRRAGFLPYGPLDGVFGYRTRAAARLFQEYVRVVDGHTEVGSPDGIVGSNTWRELDAWAAAGRVAAWAEPGFTPDPVVQLTRTLLHDTLLKQAASADILTRAVGRQAPGTATLPPDEWTADPTRVHLIGIRRNASVRPGAGRQRSNDDLFVLLAGAMTFLFVGSTDPNPGLKGVRDDEPYLVRGQHRYRFGWHKIATLGGANAQGVRVFPAFKPAVAKGVLVVRDRDRDDALSSADLAGALEANPSINIHWSGSGTANWSAGCQVVAGARYIDFHNRLVDCSRHAAAGYADLAKGKTRGAWNVLYDALAVAAPDYGIHGTELLYTLLYEEDLDATTGVTPALFRDLVERLQGRRATPVPVPHGGG